MKKNNKNKVPNRRRFKRVKTLNLIRFVVVDGGTLQGDGWVGNVRDLSEAGVQFYTQEKLPLDATIQVTILFADANKEVSILGTIAWVRQVTVAESTYQQVGISFNELSSGDQIFLKEFIESFRS